MNKISIGDLQNIDGSFIRTLIVGMQQFMLEKIFIIQIENNTPKVIPIPFAYSQTGEEQFIIDYFQDTDRYAGVFKVKGEKIKVPSGILNINSTSIDTQFLTTKYVRSNFKRRLTTPFGEVDKVVSARAAMIPLAMVWDVTIVASSDLQRLKLVELIIKRFYRTKKFKFTYDGFDGLPCTVGFPAGYDIDKELKWKYPGTDGDRPKLKFVLNTLSYLPSIDGETERFYDNMMMEYLKKATVEGTSK